MTSRLVNYSTHPPDLPHLAMSASKIIRYETLAEFRRAGDAWNDLWQRGQLSAADTTPPSACSESIGLWLEHFAPHCGFLGLAVERNGQLIAALPLVHQRMKHAIGVGSLPMNNWCWSGDLLVDPCADIEPALEMLAAEVRRAPWPLLWFEIAPLQSPRWQKFLAALKFVGSSYVASEKFRIGKIEMELKLGRDWEAYQQAWSGNHRRHMRKALRRANEEGGVELDIQRPRSGVDARALLREGFEVEHRSWKGSEQTSVLSNPPVWSYYRDQVGVLAERGQMEMTFLRHQGQAIAFEYGWRAGGVYYTPKVGYDDAYSRVSPGQLLRLLRYEQAFSEKDLQTIDFCGPLSDATAKWATATYPISRLVVETGGSGGRALLWAYQHIWGNIRRWRRCDELPQELDIVQIEHEQTAPLETKS